MNACAHAYRLTADRLLDGGGAAPSHDAAILVEGDRITAAGPAGAIPRPADCVDIAFGDATLMPGMIDAHLHTFGVPSTELHALTIEREPYRALRAAGELRNLLHAGFTSARCLGSSVGPDLRRAIAEGHIEGPRLIAAGEFISSTGGTWDSPPVPPEWTYGRGGIADGVDGVRQAVRRHVRSGVDVIKLGLSKGGVHDRYHSWGDDPLKLVAAYSLEEVRAAVDEAHRNGLMVSVHAVGEAAVRLALDGGADVIEHGYGISDETRRRLVAGGTIVVTTFSQICFHRLAYESFHYPDWERAVYERHWTVMQRDFQAGLAAGVRFALGTDLIGAPTHPLARAAKEFELVVAWGMPPAAAIRAGTRTAAEALGIAASTGTLEAGKIADVIAVKGDPLANIAALQTVAFVMHQGRIVRSTDAGGGLA